MNSKYIVRQPIKDAENRIIGYEIQYYGCLLYTSRCV